jgi:multidrug resistance efflux pump
MKARWLRFALPTLLGITLAIALLAVLSPPAHTESTAARLPYAAIARGKIDVEGGLLSVTASRDGSFSQVNVHAGDHVHRGDVLARLDSRNAQISVGLAEAELQHAQAELDMLAARLPALRQTAERWQTAATAGAAEQQQADDARQSQQQLEASMTVATASREMARQKLRQARYELGMQALTAAQDAEVVKVLVHAGSASNLQEHAAAFILLPDTPLLVRAEVNESFIARLQTGMQAEVTLEAEPGRAPLAAHVTHISPVMENGHLGDEAQVNRVVECLLQFDKRPDKNQAPLHIGQNVLVKFHE